MENTLKSLSKSVRITSEYGAKAEPKDEWQQNANGYRVTLRYKGRQFSFDFWMGQALTNEPQDEPQDVLDAILGDAQSGEMDFEEFCSEFDYDSDSRKAEQTWKQCQKTAKSLRRVFGDDYETFLYADRN